MKFLVAVLFVMMSVMTALAGDVAGEWKVSGSVYGNPVDATCTVKQEEKKLSGSCKSAQTGESAITGTVDGKNITWQFDIDFNGTPLTLVFAGKLDDAEKAIAGKINVQPMNIDGDFTASKEK